MALSFLKTAAGWVLGSDMPDDLRERQEAMERRHAQRNTVIQPRSKKSLESTAKRTKVPVKQLLRQECDEEDEQHLIISTGTETSTKGKQRNRFDSIIMKQRKSDAGAVVGGEEDDDAGRLIFDKQEGEGREMHDLSGGADNRLVDDDDDTEEEEEDDEETKQKNAAELAALREVVAGGADKIDETWTERPRTYNWIQNRVASMQKDIKQVEESKGKWSNRKEMANGIVLAPALRLRADAAKRIQRSANVVSSPSPSPNNNKKQQNQEKESSSSNDLSQRSSTGSSNKKNNQDNLNFLDDVEEDAVGAVPQRKNAHQRREHQATNPQQFHILEDDEQDDDSLHFSSDADSDS